MAFFAVLAHNKHLSSSIMILLKKRYSFFVNNNEKLGANHHFTHYAGYSALRETNVQWSMFNGLKLVAASVDCARLALHAIAVGGITVEITVRRFASCHGSGVKAEVVDVVVGIDGAEVVGMSFKGVEGAGHKVSVVFSDDCGEDTILEMIVELHIGELTV